VDRCRSLIPTGDPLAFRVRIAEWSLTGNCCATGSDCAATQKAERVALQEKHGLSEHWLEQIPELLDNTILPEGREVLLHTEVMSVRLLQQNGKLPALQDIEPAMRGAWEVRVRRGSESGAYTLLHVYSNVPWFMKGMPEAGTLDELAPKWFAQ
jgi:hygromycin-B 7''-O-kinase